MMSTEDPYAALANIVQDLQESVNRLTKLHGSFRKQEACVYHTGRSLHRVTGEIKEARRDEKLDKRPTADVHRTTADESFAA
jgi:hypothetical protein